MGAWHDGGIARDAGWYLGAADWQTGAILPARAGLHGARGHHSRAFVRRAVSGFARRAHSVLIALHAVLARSGPSDLYLDPQPTGRRANLLPAFYFSNFVFEIDSMPLALRLISYGVPARYYVSTLQTEFLAGDVWSVIVPDLIGLGVFALIIFALTALTTRTRLE